MDYEAISLIVTELREMYLTLRLSGFCSTKALTQNIKCNLFRSYINTETGKTAFRTIRIYGYLKNN